MKKTIPYLLAVCFIFLNFCNAQKKEEQENSSAQELIQKEQKAEQSESKAAEKSMEAKANLANKDNVAKKAAAQSVEQKKQTSVAPDSVLFPVVFYAVSGKKWAFEMAKKWGATHVHNYAMGVSIKKDQSYFDLAAKYGLKVMANLRMRYWLKQKNAVESVRAYVEHFSDHPALGIWYLSDEPAAHNFSVNELTPFYKMINEVTPNVPVAISHAWVTGWYKYGPVQDISLFNSYPITGGEFPEVGLDSWTNFAKTAIHNAKKTKDGFMPTMQIFNWKAFAKKNQQKVRGTAIKYLRYPNTRELNYMVFSSIAMGAEGISFYSFARSRMVNHNWGADVLSPVIDEAKSFASMIHDAKIKQILSGKDSSLFLTLWKGNSSAFIILVNASAEGRSVQQSLNGALQSGTLDAWGHTRKVEATLQNGSISVNKIKPWEVLIFEVM